VSVSPGWNLRAFEASDAPADLPRSSARQCWKADYVRAETPAPGRPGQLTTGQGAVSQGTAEVRICGYAAEGGAFDAMQRARAEAQTVKFQEGKYFVIVKWNGVSREEITALVRSIQKKLKNA
jgi:hypothetical protein